MFLVKDVPVETPGTIWNSIKTKKTVVLPIKQRPRRRSSTGGSRMITTNATIILLIVSLLAFGFRDIYVSVYAENVQEVDQADVVETETGSEKTIDNSRNTVKPRHRRQSRRHRKRNRRKMANQRIDCESDCLLGIHRRGLSSRSDGDSDSGSDDEAKIEIVGGTTTYKEEAMNCIFHCMSPECYIEWYGGGKRDDEDFNGAQTAGPPLEPGEIDIGRYIEFEQCVEEQLLQAKIAARTATATSTAR